MHFEITILGSGAGMPTLHRHSAGQVVNVRENYFLVDCGESTQLQLRRSGIRFQRIDHIFISHLHGDHFLGIPGLLFTMHLLGRTRDLHIYSFVPLKELIRHNCEVSNTHLQFNVIYHDLQTDGLQHLLSNKAVDVYSFPLKHRVDCCGFLFSEKSRGRHINKEKIIEYALPLAWMPRIKNGEDYADENGRVVPNEELTLPPDRVYSYAYCSDTKYHEALAAHIQGVDLLYHEATFMHDKKDRARETYHSTAKQAAEMALKANVGKLVIGHFSARYDKEEDLLAEARTVFANTVAAVDLMKVVVY